MESATSYNFFIQNKNDQHINKSISSPIQNKKILKHSFSQNYKQKQKNKNQISKIDIDKLNYLTHIDDIIRIFHLSQLGIYHIKMKQYFKAADYFTQIFENCKIFYQNIRSQSFLQLHKLAKQINLNHPLIDRIYDQLFNDVSYKISLVYLDISKKKQKSNLKNKLKAKRFCKDIISKVITKNDDQFGLIYSSLSDMSISEKISLINYQTIAKSQNIILQQLENIFQTNKCQNINQNNFQNGNVSKKFQKIEQIIAINEMNFFLNNQTNCPQEKKENILNQNQIQQSSILKDTLYKSLNQDDGLQSNFKFNLNKFQRKPYQNDYNCSLNEYQSQQMSFNQNSLSSINSKISQNLQTICDSPQSQLVKNFDFIDLDQNISQTIPQFKAFDKNKFQITDYF
ncbi:hypothetical protein TTHERM_000086969 (macronuclear) [Tetrahymena thermophila SB210]|uniref:Uncharacterized protein n=1 Tax=Tetrahymena thermophila (strain SB210) TaxID=312017 RepID=W7XEQ2_TETTS|nr:hypothetical protein TTHERM_000086969 [Tetrahymena thermophila SB210]EWS75218.1 hypothetical protein TTHERM_000086969 [Tetrahymena thermophila SB210]|eukprot:XP_012652209.1 hypothetical protein TTHERM_000086969 [Tetrahymena thermophila SB210]